MSKPNYHQLFTKNFPSDLSITGQYVALEPLEICHIDDLKEAVSDGELWHLKVTPIPDLKGMEEYVEQALKQRGYKRQFPFIVRRLIDGKVVGTTRYYNISPANRNLSIGDTWYSTSAQRTAINTECKLLLLEHAFEKAACISVQWHTHHENDRSQHAILRLGAKFEGVLRNHTILSDGRISHIHCFSMLDEEWQACKLQLQQRLEEYNLS